MIEKLQTWQRPLPNNPAVVENMGMDNESLFDKINELVDAVNAIQGDVKKTNSQWIHWETPTKNVRDDEIEQAKKWIGKLCWFSQIYGFHQHMAILKRISESGLYVTDDGELHYAYCEPVKPDDDIIYKGGDNE